jgi:hypothetical protein
MAHVISDIGVSTQTIGSLDDFREELLSDAPIGYSAFQTFVQGDYDYQSALFRISMHSDNGDRGVINKLSVTVDVPDMFDRGDQVIEDTTGPTRIYFARPFHIPPVVVLAVQSASDACVAKLVGTPTRKYFDMILERTSDQAIIDGAATWAAHAY